MRIAVCISQSADGELNPFDACAYEAALRIPDAEVILLSMAPLKSKPFLGGLTRLGAKRAVLLSDPAFAGADTLATAYTLSLAVKRIAPDLVICGRQTVDGGTGQVGLELSAMTGFCLATGVMALTADEDGLFCKTRSGNTPYIKYPALITVERINTLRLPSIRSKMAEVEIWDAAELKADVRRLGLSGSPTKVINTFANEQDRRKCRFIELTELEAVVKAALDREPVHSRKNRSGARLKNVWSIGGAPREMAETISDDVMVVPMGTCDEISRLIEREKPSVVLWGSDPQSKTVAAQTAARLELGLCADCTGLETDGSRLFMYRPAFAENIIAKVCSQTVPCMATVRTCEADRASVIIGAGMGVRNSLDRIRELARIFSADIVATRLMVDHDYFPYEKQVGLTGRSISPRVYIAAGISGAVHHIAGIKNSGTIIAINQDKNAAIFRYSDYGIVCGL